MSSPVFNLLIRLTACAREDKHAIGPAACIAVRQCRVDAAEQYEGIKLVLT
jgi:hypothetical protein